MKLIFFLMGTLLWGNLSYTEVMWVGDPNFEARGCSLFGGIKLEPKSFAVCNSGVFCMGKVSCYFIHKDKLRNAFDWRSIIKQYNYGIDTWVLGESGVLCAASEDGSCDRININNCANLPSSQMGCSLKKVISPSIQVIPREEGDVK